MVTIRLARRGRKKRPFFHIVVTDSRSRRDGKFIEKIGYYDPLKQVKDRAEKFNFNEERILYWRSVGAQFSSILKNILTTREFFKDGIVGAN